MIASCISSLEELHAQFLELMPKIEHHAKIYFRGVQCSHKRADRIQECVALGWKWFLRLKEQNKDVNEFTMSFVFMVAKAVKCGRKITQMEKGKDVLNERTQQRCNFKVESFPSSTAVNHDTIYGSVHGQRSLDSYEERLKDNMQTPVPEQVIFRLDWPNFLKSISPRHRQLAEFLSLGHQAKLAAERFKLSPGRVTQLRQQWHQDWQRFQSLEA